MSHTPWPVIITRRRRERNDPSWSLRRIENEWQPAAAAAADDDHFRIGRLRELHCRLDAFPLQQSIRNALGDDVLERLNAAGFDRLPFRFLSFLVELELVLERLLLLGELALNRLLDHCRQLNPPDQHVV